MLPHCVCLSLAHASPVRNGNPCGQGPGVVLPEQPNEAQLVYCAWRLPVYSSSLLSAM